jgi:hypothetical protein
MSCGVVDELMVKQGLAVCEGIHGRVVLKLGPRG